MCNTTKRDESSWLIDNGCSSHMATDLNIFRNLDKSYISRVKISNEDFVRVEGKGAIAVETKACTKILNNILYVPQLNHNLVSVGQLMESGYSLLFDDGMCNIKDKNGVLLLSTKILNRSFNIDWKKTCWYVNTCNVDESILWNKRLEHFNYATLRRMTKLHKAHGLPNIQDEVVFVKLVN